MNLLDAAQAVDYCRIATHAKRFWGSEVEVDSFFADRPRRVYMRVKTHWAEGMDWPEPVIAGVKNGDGPWRHFLLDPEDREVIHALLQDFFELPYSTVLGGIQELGLNLLRLYGKEVIVRDFDSEITDCFLEARHPETLAA